MDQQKQAERVTIYTKRSFGNVQKIEGAKLVSVDVGPYAQHQDAVFVDFIPAGKRKERRLTHAHRPFVLILKGTGHPDPDSMLVQTDQVGPMVIRESRYPSFDKRFLDDFNRIMDPHLETNPDAVIFDRREVD